ncbi:MAG: helix-turn-helix domain-containing protein [Chloroflexi bacterium]|nr:helix-turn-helix domain-containing protein [Chloroflexota bacterium]
MSPRRALGTTPARFLWDERVRHGVFLLEHTGLTVAEVADRAGFQSSFHFSRRVRAATGLPPRELRRRRWGTGGPSVS